MCVCGGGGGGVVSTNSNSIIFYTASMKLLRTVCHALRKSSSYIFSYMTIHVSLYILQH